MPSQMKKKRKVQTVLIVSGILCALAALYFSGITNHITLEKIQLKSAALKHAVDEHYIQAIILFTLSFMALIAATLPIVGLLTMLGVYLFGFIPGFFAALMGASLGSTFSFLIIRYVVGSFIRNRYKTRLEKFSKKINELGYSYLLTLQLLSIFPYVVINVLAAFTNVSTFTLFWTTLVGSMPLIFIYAVAGRQFGSMSSASDIFSPQIMVIFALFALATLLPMIVRYFKKDVVDEDFEE